MIVACSGDSGDDSFAESGSVTSSTESENTSAPTTTTTLPPIGVSTDFSRAIVELDGAPYTVAIADTPDKLSQGLMGVEVLSPLDGMLFVYDSERVVSHWMKDTLIALDIAYFDSDGFLVSKTSMTTCLDDDCPSYPAAGPALYALEVPLGGLNDLDPAARLTFIGALGGNGKEI